MGLQEKIGSGLFLLEPCEPETTAARLRIHFPHLAIEARYRFRISSELIPSLESNIKKTTIRYMPNAVDYPVACNLPIFEDGNRDGANLTQVGNVKIGALRYKFFGALNDEDATRDGFSSLKELKLSLQNFYGPIADAEIVSIYFICLCPIEPVHA